MLALGLLEILPTMAQYARHKLLTPLLRPLLGIRLYRSALMIYKAPMPAPRCSPKNCMTVKINRKDVVMGHGNIPAPV